MIDRAAAVSGGVVGLASLPATWLSASGPVTSLSGLQIPGMRWLLVGLVIVQLAGVLLVVMDRTSRVAVVAMIGEAAVSCLALLLLEVAPAFIPGGVLARTFRRSELELGAGPGPWLMLVAAALGLAACAVPRGLDLRDVSWRGWGLSGACCLMSALLVGLRGGVWVSGGLRPDRANPTSLDITPFTDSLGPDRVELAGRELPWVGPLTLTLCLSFIVACTIYLIFGTWVQLLVPGALTWVCACASATVITLAHLAHSVRLPGRFDIAELDQVHAAPVAYVVACLATTILLGLMIVLPRRSRA